VCDLEISVFGILKPVKMPHTIFKKDSEFDPKKLSFRRMKNIWDMRYKTEEQERSTSIYIQTPPLKLSLIEQDAYHYFLICKLNDRDEKFWDLMSSLDLATMEEMSEDGKSWGFKEGTPLTFIEKRFIPSIKISSINYEHSLHLIIPKSDDVYMYDQNDVPIDPQMIKKDYRLTFLLLLDGVEFKDNHFSLKFITQQIKAKIPNQVWDRSEYDESVVAEKPAMRKSRSRSRSKSREGPKPKRSEGDLKKDEVLIDSDGETTAAANQTTRYDESRYDESRYDESRRDESREDESREDESRVSKEGGGGGSRSRGYESSSEEEDDNLVFVDSSDEDDERRSDEKDEMSE